MEDTLISFETAKLAKEKGFDKVMCTGYYMGTDDCIQITAYRQHKSKDKCLASTQSLLQKWLREVHKIDVIAISVRFTGYIEIGYWTYAIKSIQPVGKQKYKFDTYEEALEQGLLKSLKLIKNE